MSLKAKDVCQFHSGVTTLHECLAYAHGWTRVNEINLTPGQDFNPRSTFLDPCSCVSPIITGEWVAVRLWLCFTKHCPANCPNNIGPPIEYNACPDDQSRMSPALKCQPVVHMCLGGGRQRHNQRRDRRKHISNAIELTLLVY